MWSLLLRTPEWPHGRHVVAVANDITFAAGAFGPAEHAVFRAASDLALRRQWPLIYIAANSGAKVGLDQKLKQLLQVRMLAVLYSSRDPVPQSQSLACTSAVLGGSFRAWWRAGEVAQ